MIAYSVTKGKFIKKFVENQCMLAETNNNKGKGEK